MAEQATQPNYDKEDVEAALKRETFDGFGPDNVDDLPESDATTQEDSK